MDPASSRPSVDRLRAAIRYGQQIALAEAAWMLAEKTRRALSVPAVREQDKQSIDKPAISPTPNPPRSVAARLRRFAGLAGKLRVLGFGKSRPRRRRTEIRFKDVIEDVRCQLLDDGRRIADAPAAFYLAWWPRSAAEVRFLQQLPSDHRLTVGPKELDEEFAAEVNAIYKCLNSRGYNPKFAEWQRRGELAEAEAKLEKSMNQRATALSLWEQITFPLRRRGDVVFRIQAPRDIFGSPGG